MEKILFIVNPTAGGGRGLKTWQVLNRVLTLRGLALDHQFTDRRGAATDLATRARLAGYGTVVAVGGDGTVQEIVNGLVGPKGDCPTALGIVPGGTGNDFSKMLGYPGDPVGALEVVLGGRIRRFDLGRANGRYFINIAGVGFDAEVAGFLNQRPKRLPGILTYIYGILTVLFRYRPALLSLDLGAEVLRQKCLLVSVANGPSHAGGFKMCPEAKPDDGLLDLCVAGDLTRPQTLLLLPKVFSGRHTLHPKVRIYKGVKKVKISSELPLFLQADGEIFGRVPAEIEVVPNVLRVIGAGEGTPSREGTESDALQRPPRRRPPSG